MSAAVSVLTGAILAGLAVVLGAFGAHALKATLEPRSLEIYHTAVQYQFYHALALILWGSWASTHPTATWPAWFFLWGTLLFSGSLYLLVATGAKYLGAVTPLGGLCFIVGWFLFAFSAYRSLGPSM